MICRNGHEIEARVPRGDGYMHCPVCRQESNSRRSRRYYQANRERLNAANAARRRAKRLGWA